MEQNFDEVLKFWFEETTPKQHWTKSDEFDNTIIRRFGTLHQKATKGELTEWRDSSLGSLAEIIILDQFSRNIDRGRPESFANDDLALSLAKEALKKGFDKDLDTKMKAFLYLPFMHSESIEDHEKAVQLFTVEGLESSLDFEHKHKTIIEKFGRYPHRNSILGRVSTPEETEFLKQPNSSF